MSTDRQQDLLQREDWRHHAIGTFGTGLGSIATVEKLGNQVVSFSLPSAPALYLSMARSACQRRQAIDLKAIFVAHPPPQGFYPEEHGLLFDYFENFASEVIFSFTALESFANEAIPSDYVYLFKSDKNSVPISLAKHEIERRVSLDEKLKRVIPDAHKICSPAGTKAWQDYKNLKDVRDRLVHLKSIDRKASGVDHQTVWGMMLNKQDIKLFEVAIRIIEKYNLIVKDRRWFRLCLVG